MGSLQCIFMWMSMELPDCALIMRIAPEALSNGLCPQQNDQQLNSSLPPLATDTVNKSVSDLHSHRSNRDQADTFIILIILFKSKLPLFVDGERERETGGGLHLKRGN